MSTVPLAKNRERGIDDAVYLDQAVDSYKAYFSGAFTSSWPAAYDRYHRERGGIDLVAGEEDSGDGQVTLVRDYDNGIDDAHYLNFAVGVYESSLSSQFRSAWPVAYQAFAADSEAIRLVEGETIESDEPAGLPEIDIDLPRPPAPSQLPADPPPPEATQLPAGQEPPKPEQY